MYEDVTVESGINSDCLHSQRKIESSHKRIRILVADDQPIVRYGLRTCLAMEPDLMVVGEIANADDVPMSVRTLDPDIILLDQRMLVGTGSAIMTGLRSANTRARVIMMANSEDRMTFVEVMRLGAWGIVLKQSAPAMIISSIRKVHGGEIWLDSETTSAVIRRFASEPEMTNCGDGNGSANRKQLSTRELEIVALVAQGLRNREMAGQLFISEQTVKNHLHNIFDKVQVSDRLALALYAIHNGLHTSIAVHPKKQRDDSSEVKPKG